MRVHLREPTPGELNIFKFFLYIVRFINSFYYILSHQEKLFYGGYFILLSSLKYLFT